MSRFEVRAQLRVREGKLEGFKQQAAEMMRITGDRDTGTLAYDWFLSADGTECDVHEAYVDADALVDHAFHVREARDAMFANFAYDHRMTFYGEPTPRLEELVQRIGVKATVFTLLQALESAGSIEKDGRAMQTIAEAASAFLASRRVAVTGVSRTPERHGSNAVYRRLRERGYEVYAVNPNAREVEAIRPTRISNRSPAVWRRS